MELKRFQKKDAEPGIVLLIVPYGIETQYRIMLSNLFMLLIVPYGIETKF